MRLAPTEHSAIRSRRLLALLALFTTLPLIVWSVDYPAWWTERGLIKLDEISGIPVPADDYAVLNQGQLKALATAAFEEIQTRLAPIGGIGNLTAPSLDDDDNVIQPGGTGWRLQYLVGGFTQNENYAAVNQGQLKATAQPFYDRLIELGFVTQYPWTGGTASNYAAANIGQAKNLFNFDPTDTDGDGLPDALEVVEKWDYDSATFNNFFGMDSDGDGFTDGYEFLMGTNPKNADSKPVTTPSDGTSEQPLLEDDEAFVLADQTVAIDILGNDFLPDGSHSVTRLSNNIYGSVPLTCAYGTATFDGRTLTYRANNNPENPDQAVDEIYYYVGNAASTSHSSNPGVGLGARAKVTVNVRKVNAVPVATNDSVTVAIGSAVNIDVLANDTDADNATLTATLVSVPGEDTAIVQDSGIIYYRPTQETPGHVTLTYRASDSYGAGSMASVDVNVVDASNFQPSATEMAAAAAKFATATAAPDSISYYVQQNEKPPFGNNSAAGTREAPLASISEALERAKIHAAANPGVNVLIVLMEGKHALLPTLTNDPESVFAPGVKITPS